ncbi:hypothetical protein AWN76_005470 [Rhodothermaceae bacterium RA]|nr:hypothetical protein AWN76_005470 [Rhodothermaceae bacterium RA]
MERATGRTEPRRTWPIGGLVMILLGVAVWVYAGTFPELDDGHPGPALFPRWIAAGLVAGGGGLCGAWLRRRWRGAAVAAEGVGVLWAGLLRGAGGLVLVGLYPVLRPLLGFIPVLSLVMLAVALMLGARWPGALLTAVAGSAVVYVLFTGLLGVPL